MALKNLEDCALFLLKTPGWNIPFGTFPAMRMVLDSHIKPRSCSSKEIMELYAQCENFYTKRYQEWKSVLHTRNLTPEDVIFLRVQGIDPETDPEN